jgi:hypothetical protein
VDAPNYVKTRRDPPPGFFGVEAAGLAWLAAAEAVGGPRVVRVFDVTEGAITLERIDTGGRRPAIDHQTFGQEAFDHNSPSAAVRWTVPAPPPSGRWRPA